MLLNDFLDILEVDAGTQFLHRVCRVRLSFEDTVTEVAGVEFGDGNLVIRFDDLGDLFVLLKALESHLIGAERGRSWRRTQFILRILH